MKYYIGDVCRYQDTNILGIILTTNSNVFHSISETKFVLCEL